MTRMRVNHFFQCSCSVHEKIIAFEKNMVEMGVVRVESGESPANVSTPRCGRLENQWKFSMEKLLLTQQNGACPRLVQQ